MKKSTQRETAKLTQTQTDKPSLSIQKNTLEQLPADYSLTPEEVGQLLRITARAVRESLINTGKLPASQVTQRRWLVRVDDVRAYLESTRTTAVAEARAVRSFKASRR